jgi:hypothetical protein
MKRVLAALATLLCGCQVSRVSTGALTHESRVVELGKYEMARVELKMGAGEMHVEGGSPKLLEADFLYNVPSWKPRVETSSSSFRADIKIEQPGGTAAGDTQYKWDLRLNNDTPVDMVTQLGAGEAQMNLGSVNLRSLRVNMGVGSLRLDLRGSPRSDCDIQIHGGVGEAVVLLPKKAGISATAKGGIGEIQVEGLERRGERWVNPAREHAAVEIHLEITGGVGDIRLVAE